MNQAFVLSRLRCAAVRMGTIALCTGVPAKASALEPADRNDHRVVVDLRACASVPEAEVRRILGIEIGDLLSSADEVPSADSDRLVVTCEGGLARLNATTAEGAQSAGRDLDLNAFPSDAAPRALALAAIEVLAALSPAVRTRVQSGDGPQPQQRVDDAQPSSTRQSSSPTSLSAGLASAPRPYPTGTAEGEKRRARGAIGVAGVVRTHAVSQGATGWGGKLGFDWHLGTWLGAGVDVEIVGVGTHVPQGEIRGLLISSGGFWSCQHVWGDTPALAASLAVGGRIGLARVAGNPIGATDVIGKSVSRAWGGPAASASLRASIGQLGLGFATESGVAVLSTEAQADGHPGLSIRGVWVALSLGMSLGY